MIDEGGEAQEFADVYFKGFNVTSPKLVGNLSPKLLVVKPESRLSWQYHNRRADKWYVVKGPVGVVRSFAEREGSIRHYDTGERIVFEKAGRHRLVGID